VIIARGGVIEHDSIALQAPEVAGPAVAVAPSQAPPPVEARSNGNVVRFADAERNAICRALELAGWRISGRGGAAESLGLKPTTLHAKMKRLGIRRPGVEHDGSRVQHLS
jgi:transcriptional regulator with GAF, ATPase, and Fis domain